MHLLDVCVRDFGLKLEGLGVVVGPTGLAEERAVKLGRENLVVELARRLKALLGRLQRFYGFLFLEVGQEVWILLGSHLLKLCVEKHNLGV